MARNVYIKIQKKGVRRDSMDGLTNSDVALLADRNNGMFGGDGMAFWIFALLLLNNGGFGGYGQRSDVVSQADLAASQNAQTQQLQMQAISDQLGQNKFDVAMAINGQTSELIAQNNTNLINAIQGFNSINISLQNMMAKMDSCCCEIKTQMLQNRYEDERARNVALQNEISNYQQSQYLLGQTGRWVGWVGSGSQTAPST